MAGSSEKEEETDTYMTFDVTQRNARSLCGGKRIKELRQEIENSRWDVNLSVRNMEERHEGHVGNRKWPRNCADGERGLAQETMCKGLGKTSFQERNDDHRWSVQREAGQKKEEQDNTSGHVGRRSHGEPNMKGFTDET